MKAREASTLCAMLAGARVTNMESADKVRVIKARKALKAAARDYDELLEDASKTLKPEGFEELNEKARRRARMTEEEAQRYMELMSAYNAEVEATVKESGEAETAPEFERLGEEAFYALCDANDWTLGQIDLLEAALCKEGGV